MYSLDGSDSLKDTMQTSIESEDQVINPNITLFHIIIVSHYREKTVHCVIQSRLHFYLGCTDSDKLQNRYLTELDEKSI